MKKVLVITYYWPPAGGPGVQRILKFVKYLPQYGWQPVVLTVEKGDYPALDPSMLDEVPRECKVVHIPILEPHALYRRLTGKKPETNIPVAVLAQNKNLSGPERIMNWLRANVFLPDARVGWYFSASKRAIELIRSEKIDALLVTSPPHSLQLIGKRVREKTGIPFIADYRDPWTDIHYYQNMDRLSVSQNFDKRLETKALNAADRVVTVSPQLARKFGEITTKPVKVIFNGYDG